MTDIIKSREVQQFGDNKLPLSAFTIAIHLACPDCESQGNWKADISVVAPTSDTVRIFDALFTCMSCGHEESHLFKLEELSRGEGIEGLTRQSREQGLPADSAGGHDERDDGSV